MTELFDEDGEGIDIDDLSDELSDLSIIWEIKQRMSDEDFLKEVIDTIKPKVKITDFFTPLDDEDNFSDAAGMIYEAKKEKFSNSYKLHWRH